MKIFWKMNTKIMLPHTVADILATSFLFISIPVTFCFELFVVVPYFHGTNTLAYNFTFLVGLFILLNIQANMIAAIFCNTSVRGQVLMPPNDDTRLLWHICAICDILAPPRSWHCDTCKTCILKRDHHCIFIGKCIGHINHRYFIIMLLYLFIGSTYSSIYNNIFIWYSHADIFGNWYTIIKIIFPFFILVTDVANGNYYLIIYVINMLGMLFSLVLLIYHLKLILMGAVAYEGKSTKYNFGWKQNIKIVFGERWYISWISPFIKSQLVHNGINWEESKLDFHKSN